MSEQLPPEATPHVIDIEEFLQPFDGDSPSGVDIREDFTPTSVYYQIKDARNAARAAEREALMSAEGADTPRADWRAVEDLAPKILKEHSKDIEIAAWYIEALLRRHGFAGLRDGYLLVKRLAETFWDDIYPRPDEDGMIDRVAPLTGLNGEGGDGTLMAPVSALAVTRAGTYDAFSAWQYDQAVALDSKSAEERQRLIDEGCPTQSMFESAARETGAAFYRTLYADLASARAAFDEATAYLDEACGYDAPPSSNVRASLDKFEQTLDFLSRDLMPDGAAASEAGDGASEGGAGGRPSRGGGGGGSALETREDAFRMLALVAEFFRRTEPHSPLSYSLDQAVRWGRLPLPELLMELIGDQTARTEFFKLSGIPIPEDSSGY